MALPHCHGMSVHPSTRLSVPSRVKLFGSFCDGTYALMSALCMMSLIASCLGSLPIFKISFAVTGRKLDRAEHCLGSITGGLALDVDKRILLTLFWKKSANSSGENLQSDVALGWLISTPIFDQSAAGSFMFEDNVLDQNPVYCSRSTNCWYWDWERRCQAVNDSSLFFLLYTCSRSSINARPLNFAHANLIEWTHKW